MPVYLASPAFAPVDGRQVAVAASPLDRFAAEGLAALAPHVTVLRDDGRTVTGVNARLPLRGAQPDPAGRLGLPGLLRARTRGVDADEPLGSRSTRPAGWLLGHRRGARPAG